MISKNLVKHIRSLHTHKFRQIHRQYIVEGEKMLKELLSSEQKILHLFVTQEWLDVNHNLLNNKNINYELVTDDMLKSISTLTTPNKVLAVVEMPENNFHASFSDGLFVVLEDLQDPGNMGTIIRSSDWFGVKAIFCSENTVDVFNPKVVQSSMGSVFRMPVHYTNLEKLLADNKTLDTYAAVLGGKNVYDTTFPKNAILFIGNESKGLSNNIKNLCKHHISIPSFGKAESLNAAVACSVLLGLMRR